MGNSRKGFKNCSQETTAVASAPIYNNSFANIFSDFPIKWDENEIRIWISYLDCTLKRDFLALKSIFGFRAVYCKIPKKVFQNPNTQFPIERTPTTAGSGTQVGEAFMSNPANIPL